MTKENMPRCNTCANWTQRTKHDWDKSGMCRELKASDKVTIELKTGWDGGYVDYVETEPDFGCVLHEPRKEE